VAVFPVSGNDSIFQVQGLEASYRHRLLADVEVEEPVDLTGAIKLGALLLKAADAHHLPE
jgi:hypothetical protein